MHAISRVGYLFLILSFVACGVKTADALWESAKNDVDRRQYESAIKALEKLTVTYPDSSLAPQAQFLIGDIFMTKKHEIDRALAAFQKVVANYPDYADAVKALFMIGFVKANYLTDYDGAREAYNDFLVRYPNHELIHSVNFELANLGRPIEDIDVLKDIVNAR